MRGRGLRGGGGGREMGVSLTKATGSDSSR